jgi:hypothetical protein
MEMSYWLDLNTIGFFEPKAYKSHGVSGFVDVQFLAFRIEPERPQIN